MEMNGEYRSSISYYLQMLAAGGSGTGAPAGTSENSSKQVSWGGDDEEEDEVYEDIISHLWFIR